MSTAEEGWELAVPDDADELAAELRRHGIKPGQRLHFDVIQSGPDESRSDGGSQPEGPRAARMGLTGNIESLASSARSTAAPPTSRPTPMITSITASVASDPGRYQDHRRCQSHRRHQPPSQHRLAQRRSRATLGTCNRHRRSLLPAQRVGRPERPRLISFERSQRGTSSSSTSHWLTLLAWPTWSSNMLICAWAALTPHSSPSPSAWASSAWQTFDRRHFSVVRPSHVAALTLLP